MKFRKDRGFPGKKRIFNFSNCIFCFKGGGFPVVRGWGEGGYIHCWSEGWGEGRP